MLTGSFFFHLLGVLRHALWRVLGFFAVVGAIAVVLTEIMSIVLSGGQLPSLSTHVIALALGLGAGWAAGGTILAVETIRGLVDSVEEVEREFVKEIKTAAGIADNVARHVEGR